MKNSFAMTGSPKGQGTRDKGKLLSHVTCYMSLFFLWMYQVLFPVQVLAAQDIYKDMLKMTQQELLQDGNGDASVDLHVKRFTAKVLSKDPYNYYRSEVQKSFDVLQWPQLLSKNDHRPTMAYGPGSVTIGDLRTVAGREERVRALGRELQLIATSYEAPVISPEYGDFPAKARATIRIWQAGTGSVVRTDTGLVLRAIPMDNDQVLPGRVKNVGTALKDLLHKDDAGMENREDFVAAMWRYMHGVRFVLGERKEYPKPPDINGADPGTERQFLKKRFATVENALKQLWDDARVYAQTNMKVEVGEVVWFTLTDESRDKLLPENVNVWVYVEKLRDGTLSGDAGLQWGIATEPVLPSLCNDMNGAMEGSEKENLCAFGAPADKITTLGGLFPPPPVDGTGLCTEPFQRLGYICRPLSGDAGTTICKQDVKQDKTKILLSACTKDTGTKATLMGPDVCASTTWNDPTAFNPQTNCKITLKCDKLPFGGAQTAKKAADGTIVVTVKSSKLEEQGPPVPLIIHELTHAQQTCGLPPGFDAYAGYQKMTPDQYGAVCCKNEGEAYKSECEMFDQDGLFKDPATGAPKLLSIVGTDGKPKNVELNVETCWQLLTDASCRERGSKDGVGEVRCPNTFTFSNTNTLSIQKAAFEDLTNYVFKNIKGPKTCADALDPKKLDPRIVAAKRAVEQTNRQVCDPRHTTTYPNTIGGSMCYIGQCLEQSIEDHRLIPGRQTFAAGDEAFTAESCIGPTIDSSTIVSVPLKVAPPLPPYRPGLLIQSLDAELCQQNGLPPQSPPSRCAFNALRTLASPEEDILKTAISLWKQPQGLVTTVGGTEKLSEALGARVASEWYGNYLKVTVPKLSVLTTEAASLLNTFTKIKFSAAMCPYKDPGGDWLQSNFKCK